MAAQQQPGWRVVSAEYETSAPDLSHCPPPGPPEVAFAGRSNVGKSSLLNAVTGRRGLARVGSTPGRTQLLNFFRVELRRGGERRMLRIVDLPGYGFAATGRKAAERFAPMIEGYLGGRETLKALALLIDARRGVDERDVDLLAHASELGVPCLLVVTKIDKLGKAKRGTVARDIAAAVGAHPHDIVLTSASDNIGIADAGRGGLLRDLADLADPDADADADAGEASS